MTEQQARREIEARGFGQATAREVELYVLLCTEAEDRQRLDYAEGKRYAAAILLGFALVWVLVALGVQMLRGV